MLHLACHHSWNASPQLDPLSLELIYFLCLSSQIGIAGALANLTLGTERSSEQVAYENQFRRANWESGQIDYLGKDSFDNIWAKIQSTIEAPPAEIVAERERSRSRTPQRSPEPEQPATAPAPVVEQVKEVVQVVQQAAAPAPVAAAPAPVVSQPKAAAAPAASSKKVEAAPELPAKKKKEGK